MIKAVISDLGRVLIDFDNSIFFSKMSRHSPFSEEEIKEMMFENESLISAFDLGELTPEEFHAQAMYILKSSLSFGTFFSIYNDVFSLNSRNVRILKKLKRNYRLVMLSNTDVMRFGFIKRKFPQVMFFDEYVLSFEVGCMKPSASIYRIALEKALSEPKECVFLDDREENVEAAMNLGIRGIHIAPGIDLEKELKKEGLKL
ncbi:MAG: HAD family hydrolase [Candidatus Aminicenantales bacterium]